MYKGKHLILVLEQLTLFIDSLMPYRTLFVSMILLILTASVFLLPLTLIGTIFPFK